ncbi:Retrovirus-related Pol polyprotein from transposon TNT 1-94 [Porphyridium purpureum]|uniref:Retrovirus-related Pol polyprotein from transposon TNT 1-94 n=1 Tax=Porphyridium purpureum TaxID=35688 RepID=A0A5J4Z4M6_PORPP|nr:Retrovirus-related Pol polyprotein from transposon TNT 1-94 [Porphyridium purpureum]|eukprot:POR0237..scf295_1
MVGPPGIDILSDESEPLHEETNGNQTSQIEEGLHTVEREDVEPATNEWTFEEDLSLASGLHALGWGEWNRIVARDELRGRSAIDAERRAEVLGITHDNAAEILNDLFPGQSALVAELITDKITLNSKAASQAVKRELDAVMSMHVFDPKKVVAFREASTDPSAQFVRGKMMVARKNVEQDTSQQLLKARLVAQGCVLFNGSGHLVRDDDFQYERPIGLRSSRYVLAHGRAAGDLAKFDVDSAYLSADSRGPRTYLELPESVRPDAWAGFERPVVPMQKALPGLPRSGADFGAEARRRLTERGWHQTQSDMNLYHKAFESADVLLALYVDDGLLAGDISALGFAIQEMLELFKISKPVQRISENGRVDFLGMRVRAENQNEWVLDSADYCALFVKDAMKKLGYKEVGKHRIARKVHTPLHDEVVELATASDSTCCEPWVRSLIGQLMWLARAGRPDVAHAAAWIARHVDAWNDAAAMALDRTVRYLAWHTNLGIPFKRPQVTTKQGLAMAQVDAYSDADYAGCLKTRKSTSGFLVFARVGEVDYLIDWHSSRQRACSTSTKESELAALTHTVKLGVMPILLLQEHMRKQARESCHAKPFTPIVRCDNEAAVASVKKGWSDKLLHMAKTHGVELAWLHELTEQAKNLLLMRVGTKQNTADMMTKALSADKFGLHRGRILCVAASSEGACDDIAVRPNGETGSGSVPVTRAPQPVGLDGDAPLGQLVRPTAKTREGARPLTSTRATPPQGRARTAEAKCSAAALFKRQPPLAWRLGTTWR